MHNTKIKQWLNDRGISDEVIEDSGLTFHNNKLIIPVRDPEGRFLFNKSRRNPLGEETGSKYTYDIGSTAQLYNAHKLWRSKMVIVCEGELDALALQTIGYVAVSGTGGASTFKDEWVELLKGKDVYICYDNDKAGISGAIKLLAKIPDAKIITIPNQEGVKDITDYLKLHNIVDFIQLIFEAKEFPVLASIPKEFKYLKEVQAEIKKLNSFLNDLLNMERAEPSVKLYSSVKSLATEIMESLKAKENLMRFKRSKPDAEHDIDIETAKAIPVSTLLPFKKRWTKCLWHEPDTHPSLYVYPSTNRVKCFVCGTREDSISITMKLYSISFVEAVKKLTAK